MPHFDGPLYNSRVVVISLGGPAILNFSKAYGAVASSSVLL
jgi:hypothetical protein